MSETRHQFNHLLRVYLPIPKIVNRLDLVFPKPGVEPGECNEFCGIGHTQMRFAVHVLTAQQFAAWVSQRQGRAR